VEIKIELSLRINKTNKIQRYKGETMILHISMVCDVKMCSMWLEDRGEKFEAKNQCKKT
jgi:hypothetical protein